MPTSADVDLERELISSKAGVAEGHKLKLLGEGEKVKCSTMQLSFARK